MGDVGWGVIRKAGVGWEKRRDRDQDSTKDRSHRLRESNLKFSATTASFFLPALNLSAPDFWQIYLGLLSTENMPCQDRDATLRVD